MMATDVPYNSSLIGKLPWVATSAERGSVGKLVGIGSSEMMATDVPYNSNLIGKLP